MMIPARDSEDVDENPKKRGKTDSETDSSQSDDCESETDSE